VISLIGREFDFYYSVGVILIHLIN